VLGLYTLAAASGLLQTIIFPNLGLYRLSWIALTPLLYALLTKPRVQILLPGAKSGYGEPTTRQGFWLGYFCGVIWYGGTCYWVYHVMNSYGGLPPAIAAGILVLFCLYLGLYHGLFAALLVRASRGGVTRALVVAPFLWVAVELARARITGFPWDLLGTTQVNNPIVSPLIATVCGVYGISFVIAAVNACLVAAFLVRSGRSVTAAMVGIVIATGFMCGELVTRRLPPPTHVAALVQVNLPLEMQWSPEVFDQTMGKLSDLSRQAVTKDDAPPRLIIWPESPGPFFVMDPKFRVWMTALAQDRDAFIIAGSLGTPEGALHPEEIYNSAALIAPSGQFVSRYDKVHLVPFGEYVPFKRLFFFAKNLTKEVGTFTPGAERKVFSITQGDAKARIGVFICYESVFPDEIREFAANGAQVFVNISNDGWFGSSGAGRQGLNMARMRAMENHRWLLRATNTGITASVDPEGRITADVERDKQTTLRAPYDLISDTTFYTRHGDWFAWACAIISWVIVFWRLNFRVGVIR
jgi:apolipoprotein N-acyltransferase